MPKLPTSAQAHLRNMNLDDDTRLEIIQEHIDWYSSMLATVPVERESVVRYYHQSWIYEKDIVKQRIRLNLIRN